MGKLLAPTKFQGVERINDNTWRGRVSIHGEKVLTTGQISELAAAVARDQ